MASRLFIGIMSGTSCDGVDAALVRVDGVGPAMRATFLHLTSVDYTADDRTAIGLARGEHAGAKLVATVENLVAERYVACVRALLDETSTRPADVTALAAHGQTLFHQPPLTVQAFNPTILAGETGIDVVSDFRRADCAAGGQGAPLVPFGDWVMFRAGVPRAAEPDDLQAQAQVTGLQRANLVLALAISQAVQVLLLALAVFGFFMVFGLVAIDESVITSWVGDGHPTYPSWGSDHLFSIELTQVSIFLAGFSGLYFTVTAVTDETYRREFFTRVRLELEKAVTVRILYRHRTVTASED